MQDFKILPQLFNSEVKKQSKYYDIAPSKEKQIIEHLSGVHRLLLQRQFVQSNYALFELLNDNVYYAGGCIRNIISGHPINDYDIYFTDQKSALNFKGFVDNMRSMDIRVLSSTENAVTCEIYGDKYQFITKYYGNPITLISKFDYTNCMGYFFPKSTLLYISKEMKKSLATKWIDYNPDSWNPALSLKRLKKFILQGYKISDKNLMKLAFSLKESSKEEIEKLGKSNY